MAEIESKSLAYENADWSLPQQEMNAKGYEWFALWDDELNALWGRLTATLSETAICHYLCTTVKSGRS